MIARGDVRRNIARIPRVLTKTAIFSVLALCACAAQPTGSGVQPTPLANSGETELFSETYQSIIEYHVDATRADALSLAALGDLTSVDPDITVNRDGDDIALHRGSQIWRLHAPAPFDTAAWGTLTATLVQTARDASPKVAAVAPDKLEQELIDHMLATLDRFSHYARPAVAREWRAARDGYGGIGIILADAPETRITAVMADSPAARAGIHINDRIVMLDGVSSNALSPTQLRSRLRGPALSTVVLGIQRAGLDKPLNLTLQRAHLVPPSVTLEERGDVAVIAVASFNQQTGDGVIDALARAHREMGGHLKGIVLDLRGNPGGLLDQSVIVASQFLDGGTIATTIGRNPESFQYFAAPADHHADSLPLVVLVNGGSASASEIVASALQDAGRAVVVGTSSYGKGTVQTVLRTSNDGELTVTWARLIAPKGYFLHHHGVVPTVCTAGLADNADAGVILAKSPGPTLNEAREALDDAGWTALRAACPPAPEHDPLDLRVARHLLENPVIYARLLGNDPVRLAHDFHATTAH
ncbi:MAG TPA: S41 family peptidase [Stellaceae bacterium]|nr:S41 family peptidase [Stellaceae bacterium]